MDHDRWCNTVMYRQPRYLAIFIFEIIQVSLHVVSVFKLLNLFLLSIVLTHITDSFKN